MSMKSLIRLTALQGAQIYTQNQLVIPKTLTAKNNSAMKMFACRLKEAHQ